MAIAQSDPANAGGNALEFDARERHVEPVMQVLVVRQQFLDVFIRPENILQVAGERSPPEGRSAEHTSELQSLISISYDVFRSNKKTNTWLSHLDSGHHI